MVTDLLSTESNTLSSSKAIALRLEVIPMEDAYCFRCLNTVMVSPMQDVCPVCGAYGTMIVVESNDQSFQEA